MSREEGRRGEERRRQWDEDGDEDELAEVSPGEGQMLVVLGGVNAPCYGLVVTALHEDFSWDSLRRVRGTAS
jgi:hypothetical protein